MQRAIELAGNWQFGEKLAKKTSREKVTSSYVNFHLIFLVPPLRVSSQVQRQRNAKLCDDLNGLMK
ncbi:hypothetical protein RP20_CCG010419 [Aedes albopictus]|nr:hypothetical protein RP20_CCG010419 [Aedes albopictus]